MNSFTRNPIADMHRAVEAQYAPLNGTRDIIEELRPQKFVFVKIKVPENGLEEQYPNPSQPEQFQKLDECGFDQMLGVCTDEIRFYEKLDGFYTPLNELEPGKTHTGYVPLENRRDINALDCLGVIHLRNKNHKNAQIYTEDSLDRKLMIRLVKWTIFLAILSILTSFVLFFLGLALQNNTPGNEQPAQIEVVQYK